VETNLIAFSHGQNMILFMGLRKNLGDAYVRQIYVGDRDIPWMVPCILKTCRLGKFNVNAARPRPVLARFKSTRGKNAAFQHSCRLRRRSISLAEDLTPKQQENRRRLIPHVQAFKAKGCAARWRGRHLCFRQADGKIHQWSRGTPSGPKSCSWVAF
jgi:hypothetical protein